MPITALRAGWAEQDPDMWWKNLRIATAEVLSDSGIKKDSIIAVVFVPDARVVIIDKNHQVLRPSIIWCDSRAVEIGRKAFSLSALKNVSVHS